MERRMLVRRGWLAVLAGAILGATAEARDLVELGPVLFEARSAFSLIRVRDRQGVRTLSFVRDSGEEVIESQVDLRRPADLLIPYTRSMFLSYLHQPQPQKALIVGLGGGAMVHFLKHYDPQLQVDVVEIDPVVVRLADEGFGVRTEGKIRIVTQDAFVYLAETTERYDVIYMDAFLKPSAETDTTGVPLKLKTAEFYRGVRSKLTPTGIMVFNLNPHPQVGEDLAALREAFPQTDVYRLQPGQGFVAIGLPGDRVPSPREIGDRAAELDRRFRTTFSFRTLVRSRVR